MDHAEPTQPPVEKAPPMTPPPAHPKDSGGARFPLSTSTPTGPIPVVRRRPVTGKSLSDHVLASGRDVNVLVLDTEVYSNTGGQASKSTPMGQVAKFATAGKMTNKKDMAMQAVSYGDVYVARVALGADPEQTLKAFREAEAYHGPSLIIAYSHCISHGFNMRLGLEQQYKAVASGHWPLFRYNPETRNVGGNPFLLDSARPRIPLKEYRKAELRFKMLMAKDPAEAERLTAIAQEQVNRRWAEYEEMASRPAEMFAVDARKEV